METAMPIPHPKSLAAVVLACLLSSCATPHAPVAKSCYHLDASIETEIGYCQAVRVGHTLHISGSVGKGEMPDAIRKAYGELRETLKAYGLDFRDVVKENVYTTDLDAFIRNKDVRKEFYGADFPAATWVQVQRLYTPSLVLEVEVTAQIR
jgi:enamine deaminase RidA (YjgF/YER057c/UK114 family)